MGWDDDDAYVNVNVEFIRATEIAILVKALAPGSDGVWIPRSCLHGGLDKAVDDWDRNDQVEIKIRLWKAREVDLI
jgi:hypothetical protein